MCKELEKAEKDCSSEGHSVVSVSLVDHQLNEGGCQPLPHHLSLYQVSTQPYVPSRNRVKWVGETLGQKATQNILTRLNLDLRLTDHWTTTTALMIGCFACHLDVFVCVCMCLCACALSPSLSLMFDCEIFLIMTRLMP